MKILYLNPDRGVPVLGDKGASVHVRCFVAAAARLGHEVVLACATIGHGNAQPPGRIIEVPVLTDQATIEAEVAARPLVAGAVDDPVGRRELARLAHDRALMPELLGILHRIGFEPDLVYERHALFSRAGVRIARHFGVPRLLEVNAPLVAEQRAYRGLYLADLAHEAEVASYKGANAIIAVSEAVAAHVRGVIGGTERIQVIPNGVELAHYRNTNDRDRLRERLGIGAAPVIGFIGSFKPWHGVDFLFGVFADLARVRPALRLHAVGDGPDLPAIRALADASGLAARVVLPGRVPHADIGAWLATMDVTVAPYREQPDFYFSPLKIVESLAAGRPVVAPRIGQISQMIDHGVTGLLYPPGDAGACRVALLDLIDHPERRAVMGVAGRSAAAGWDWTAIVARALASAPQKAKVLAR